MKNFSTATEGPGTMISAEQLIESINRAMEVIDKAGPALARIVFTPSARKQAGWNFEPSPHRSKRLHKKLLKRYGSHERWKPAILKIGDMIFAHPSLDAGLRDVIKPAEIVQPFERRVDLGFSGGYGAFAGVPVCRFGV